MRSSSAGVASARAATGDVPFRRRGKRAVDRAARPPEYNGAPAPPRRRRTDGGDGDRVPAGRRRASEWRANPRPGSDAARGSGRLPRSRPFTPGLVSPRQRPRLLLAQPRARAPACQGVAEASTAAPHRRYGGARWCIRAPGVRDAVQHRQCAPETGTERTENIVPPDELANARVEAGSAARKPATSVEPSPRRASHRRRGARHSSIRHPQRDPAAVVTSTHQCVSRPARGTNEHRANATLTGSQSGRSGLGRERRVHPVDVRPTSKHSRGES